MGNPKIDLSKYKSYSIRIALLSMTLNRRILQCSLCKNTLD